VAVQQEGRADTIRDPHDHVRVRPARRREFRRQPLCGEPVGDGLLHRALLAGEAADRDEVRGQRRRFLLVRRVF